MFPFHSVQSAWFRDSMPNKSICWWDHMNKPWYVRSCMCQVVLYMNFVDDWNLSHRFPKHMCVWQWRPGRESFLPEKSKLYQWEIRQHTMCSTQIPKEKKKKQLTWKWDRALIKHVKSKHLDLALLGIQIWFSFGHPVSALSFWNLHVMSSKAPKFHLNHKNIFCTWTNIYVPFPYSSFSRILLSCEAVSLRISK